MRRFRRNVRSERIPSVIQRTAIKKEEIMENYISLYAGKYGVINDNGRLHIFRHHERWIQKEGQYIGDGFVLALVQKIEDLQEELKAKN